MTEQVALRVLFWLLLSGVIFLAGYFTGKHQRQDEPERPERRIAPLEDSPRPPIRLETSDLGIGWEPLDGEGSSGRARYL